MSTIIKLGEIVFGNGRGIRNDDPAIQSFLDDALPSTKGIVAIYLIVVFVAMILVGISGNVVYGSMPFYWQYAWREFLVGFVR